MSDGNALLADGTHFTNGDVQRNGQRTPPSPDEWEARRARAGGQMSKAPTGGERPAVVAMPSNPARTVNADAIPDFPLTDAGNGERLMQDHGDKLKFVALLKKPIVYGDGVWSMDDTGAADRLALDTIRRIKKLGACLSQSEDDEKHALGLKLLRHAHNSESNRRLTDMLTRASKVHGASIMPDKLDRDLWKFNVLNGTIDLKTITLLPHCRDDFITKISPVKYDPSATCPDFLAYLDAIFECNGDLIRFIQRAIGYTLSGITTERAMFILYGCGSNGKSTLLGIVRELMGTYGTQTAADTLMTKRHEGIPNDVARLKGARYVSAVEVDEGKRLAEGLVKRMTGGEDVLTARYLFSEFFDFVPTFKLWLATNHKPLIRGTDPAIWDRIKLIPFNRRFEESEKDKELPKRLKLELPGILNWVIEGCRDWQQNGLGVPAVVSDATKEYRDEMDFLAEFIADQCVVGPKCEAGATALYDRYRIWAQVNREEPISQTKLGRQLQNRGFGSGKDAKGCKTRIGIGICAKGNVSPDSYGGTSGSSREDFDSTGS